MYAQYVSVAGVRGETFCYQSYRSKLLNWKRKHYCQDGSVTAKVGGTGQLHCCIVRSCQYHCSKICSL